MFSNETHYLGLAAAYVRGSLPEARDLADAEAILLARKRGLRIHRFKRNAELPRVRTVVGILRGIAPDNLLDVGSGRGTFLWPLLDAFPGLAVTSMEADAGRHCQIACVAAGAGGGFLVAVRDDARNMSLADGSFDVVTILEVLEHLPDPERAVSECLRVARRFVVASVPSKPDDNPEHVQLFTPQSLETLFRDSGAASVKVQHVHGHMVCLAAQAG